MITIGNATRRHLSGEASSARRTTRSQPSSRITAGQVAFTKPGRKVAIHESQSTVAGHAAHATSSRALSDHSDTVAQHSLRSFSPPARLDIDANTFYKLLS